jgi:GNAT superfamily N-acetyltransferase
MRHSGKYNSRVPGSVPAPTAPSYSIRPATLDDADALVRHRIGMFTDMGVPLDAPLLEREFRAWLGEMMPNGTYRAWVVEAEARAIVAGGGMTILPWPPGPRYMGSRLAFVYNVYTEPAHRRRGLARLLMDAMHAWGRAHGIASMALNASRDGQPLYEAMGYALSPAPLMFLPLSP